MGWYAVRNRAQDEVNDEYSFKTRDIQEAALFSKGIWKDSTTSGLPQTPPISSEVFGIKKLKTALSHALLKGVEESFPSLCEEMRNMKSDIEQQRETLGDPRNTDTLQRSYIYKIQVDYKEELERSVRGDYRKGADENHRALSAIEG